MLGLQLTGCNGDASAAPVGPPLGPTCHNDDPNHLCLGVKYVVYKDAAGQLAASQDAALKNLKTMNQIWSSCNISFQIDQFGGVNPSDFGLKYRTQNTPELDDVRNSFADDSTLLMVTTGQWDRSGTLGSTKANAWTAMPGGAPYGVVLEKPVGDFAGILAHELGHYLNLNHVNDSSDLMDPIIYSQSTFLSDSQCAGARATALGSWQKMIR